MTDEWLTVMEVAALLKVAPKTVRKLLRDGDFPCKAVKLGNVWRIDARDVAYFVAELPGQGA